MTKKQGLRSLLCGQIIRSKLHAPSLNNSTAYQRGNTKNGASDIPSATTKSIEPDSSIGKTSSLIDGPPATFNDKNNFGRPAKTEIRTRIEELRKQLLAILNNAGQDRSARVIAAKERARLIRCIERLEAQERREKENSLIATGKLPEPISESEKRQLQQERERVRKALAGKEKIKAKAPYKRGSDDDPNVDADGETRKLLGMSLKRRKLEFTGRWEHEIRNPCPELTCEGYSQERLRKVLLCGASEEHKAWLGEWFRRLDVGGGAGKGVGR